MNFDYYRFFFAHSANDSDETIEARRSRIAGILEAEGIVGDLVNGRDDFREHAPGAGGWRGWPADVVYRQDWTTGGPYFSGFIAGSMDVGKATAEILFRALQEGRPVYALTDDDGLVEVSTVECHDSQDSASGWHLS